MREKELIRACKRNDLQAVQDLLYETKSKKSLQRPKAEDVEKRKTKKRVTHIDVNYREEKYQMTPLMIASLQGARDIVVFLIYFGADVSLRDVKGNTSLQLACMKQKFHVIYTLLKSGANPNDINSSGWNCLISAVNYFDDDSSVMLLTLLQAGVKSEHKDNNGLMVIDHCVKKYKISKCFVSFHFDLRKIKCRLCTKKKESIRVILNYNTKLAQFCSRALVNASIKGQLDIVLLLLNFGVNPNKIDIITGTSAQHEAVRYDASQDNEKSRETRLKIIQYLAAFGANPDLSNTRGETPMKLVPRNDERFVRVLQTYFRKPHKTPKYINAKAKTLNELVKIPKNPLLKPRFNWTRDDFRFCSTCYVQTKKNTVTNLIDGDVNSTWTVNGREYLWIVFDLKANHTLTRVRIYGWNSKEMPCVCQLQASNSLDGPWNNIHTFRCDMIGSTAKDSPGYPQDFDNFIATAQYWRLVIIDNHGSPMTSFHGIEFFGYDTRVTKVLDQLRLNELEDLLFENDLNQVEALIDCSQELFDSLSIESESDRKKLWNFILDMRERVSSFKRLQWIQEMPLYCQVGEMLDTFGVYTNEALEVSNSLKLVCHGGAILSGNIQVDLVRNLDMNEKFVALFDDISFLKPGKFLVEIQAILDPNVYISASQPIVVYSLDDPRYPGKKLNTQKQRIYIPPLSRLQSFETQYSNELPEFSNRTQQKWLYTSNTFEQTYPNEDDDKYTITRDYYFTNDNYEPPKDYNEDVPENKIDYDEQELSIEFNEDTLEEIAFHTRTAESKVYASNEPSLSKSNEQNDYFASKSSLYGHFHNNKSSQSSTEHEHEIIIQASLPSRDQNDYTYVKKPSVSFHPEAYQIEDSIESQQQQQHQQRESRYIKQQAQKNLKIIKTEAYTEQVPTINGSITKNSFSKTRSSRETPSPHTIDRILDEVFEDISEDSPYIMLNSLCTGFIQSERSDDYSLDDLTESTNGILDVTTANTTFTNKAKRVLDDYKNNKSKQDSSFII